MIDHFLRMLPAHNEKLGFRWIAGDIDFLVEVRIGLAL